MFLIVLVLILGLLIGAGLVVWGWRGRRMRRIIAGVVVMLMCAAPLAMVSIVEVDWSPYTPTWLLWWDLRYGSETVQESALDELERRMEEEFTDRQLFASASWLLRDFSATQGDGDRSEGWPFAVSYLLTMTCLEIDSRLFDDALTESVPLELIDAILDLHADADQEWHESLGSLIETLEGEGKLDRERWERYVAGVPHPQLWVRRRIGLHDPLVFSPETLLRAAAYTSLFVRTQVAALRVSGHELSDMSVLELGPPIPTAPMFGSYAVVRPIIEPAYDKVITAQIVREWSLSPGEHTLEADVVVSVWRDDTRSDLLLTRNVTCREQFTVLPDGEFSVRIRDADEQRKVIGGHVLEASLTPPHAENPGWSASIFAGSALSVMSLRQGSLRWSGDTFTLSAGVILQVADYEQIHLGEVFFPLTSGAAMLPYPGPPPKPGDTVRFIFKPNPELAKRTIDVHDIWGEEIIFEQTYRSPTTPRRGISPSPDQALPPRSNHPAHPGRSRAGLPAPQ